MKATSGMSGLINHMKEAKGRKESERQSVWKEVKHFMPPMLSVKFSDQRLFCATAA